jgi:uncharacterized protein (DUF433 family)
MPQEKKVDACRERGHGAMSGGKNYVRKLLSCANGAISSMSNRTELLQRISIDPRVCFGKPCVKGTRLWVSLMLDLLAEGWTLEEILKEYPGLMPEDIRACVAYGAEMARERYVEVPATAA